MSNQRGFILVEALIVTSIFVFGFVAGSKTQAYLIREKNATTQQSQAIFLSDQKIEQFRSYPTLADYNNIVSGSDTVSAGNASYTRTWTVTDYSGYKKVDQSVSWTGADNQSQSVSISSYISQNDYSLSGQSFNLPPTLPTPGG